MKKFTRGLKTFQPCLRVLLDPTTPQTLAKAERKGSTVWEHRKIEMEKRLKEYNWASVNNTRDASEAVSILTDAIGRMNNDCFPLIKVKISSRDPPYMTPLVKYLCKM